MKITLWEDCILGGKKLKTGLRWLFPPAAKVEARQEVIREEAAAFLCSFLDKGKLQTFVNIFQIAEFIFKSSISNFEMEAIEEKRK